MIESRSIDLETLSREIGATLVAGAEGSRLAGPAATDITGLAYDSRAVEVGHAFFCVPGERADGHAHAGTAVERGAAALVVEHAIDLRVARDVPQLRVGDTRAAMAPAADAFYGRPTRELAVAGVTGTNGKTTTAFLLFSLLAAAGRRPGLLGTIECRVGGERRPVERTTPEAIDLQAAYREMLDAGDRSCAMECSSHASALRRLDRTRFRALIFTNLTQDHLDFHGSMEAYFDAKRRLFVEPDVDGMLPPAAVSVDDPFGRRLAEERRALGGSLLTFGLGAEADVRPDGLELAARGARFSAAGVDLHTRLRGTFNVANVLGAVAAAKLLGLDNDAIARGIAHLAGVPGRFEAVDEGQSFSVIVDYAHTPDALASVLVAARELATGRLICVFGCGGDRDRAKRPEMGRAAVANADAVVVTSDNPRSEDPEAIIAEIQAGIGSGGEVEIEPDRRRAIRLAVEMAAPGDVVVIAGKGHERGQELRDRTVPFSDVEEAREALRLLGAAARERPT